MSASSLKILMLSHDVSDPATHRRVRMLTAGGATVSIAGFRRTPAIEPINSECPVYDWGQTGNGAFIQRIVAVMRVLTTINQRLNYFNEANIVLARNLETLAIAVCGCRLSRKRPKIIYEVLDIHRLLLRRDIIGSVLRTLEGWLARQSVAVMTSSPAFITNYFRRLSHIRKPFLLIENKVLDIEGDLPDTNNSSHKPTPPWIIGWFGVIRCRKSLLILRDFVQQSRGNIEVVIRGRPALDQIPDFQDIIASTPGITFAGPYKNPDDLAAIYGAVHFTWAIDMYEEGLNSSWLLPNRLYEGSYYGAIPLAVAEVETGHFLQRLGIGVCLQQPLNLELSKFFSQLNTKSYQELADAIRKTPSETWVYRKSDCQNIVDQLRNSCSI